MVDGVAFGRPRLRATRDRPPVHLPPRKRARIEYADDDDDEAESEESFEHSTRQRALDYPIAYAADHGSVDEESSDSDDKDYASDSTTIRYNVPSHGQDDDSEYNASEDEEEDLEEEIRVLQEDNRLIGEGEDDTLDSPAGEAKATVGDGVSTFDRAMRAPIAAFKSAFPRISEGVIQGLLLSHAQDLRSTYGALMEMQAPKLPFDRILELCLHPSEEDQSPPSLLATELHSPPGFKRPLIQEVEDTTPSLVRRQLRATSENSTSSSGDSSSEDGESNSADDSTSSDEDSSSADSSDDSSDSDEGPKGGVNVTASSDDSDSDSEGSSSSSVASDDDNGDKGKVKTIKGRKRKHIQSADSSDDDSFESFTSSTDDTSSSEDDSSSSSEEDSGSEPDELSAKPALLSSRHGTITAATISTTHTALPEPVLAEARPSVADKADVPPGDGLSKTQKRNRRRRDMKRRKALESEQSQPTQTSCPTDDADFLARKKALLDAVAAGDSPQQNKDAARELNPSVNKSPNDQTHESREMSQDEQPEGDATTSPMELDATASDKPADAASQEEAPRRRMRMDLGAGRRLLFGALGLKTPKTKADEEKLKGDLMKDVRPLKNHRQAETEADTTHASQDQQPEPAEAVDQEVDSVDWKTKIKYRAVECCQEGIELSEPPFPFVQRWDPQQQGGRKRKRSSHNHYQEDRYDESYQDEAMFYEGADDWVDRDQTPKEAKVKKKKKDKGTMSKAADYTDTAHDIELNYDEPPVESRGDSSQFTDVDDLPSLPSDVTALPALQSTEVKPGMVITWKQLLMSKATNWQPELSSTTGLVVSMDNGCMIHVVLAKRDREQDEKEYDEETGRRVYDRFEMPSDSEEEEAQSDDGRRELPWAELIEPRLVQAEPSTSVFSSPNKAVKDGAKNAADHDEDNTSQRKQADSEQHVSPTESSSIPSGQGVRLLDFPAAAADLPVNGESQEKVSQTQSVESRPLPSPSPQDTSSQVRVFPPSSAHEETSQAAKHDVSMGADAHVQGGHPEMSDGTRSESASAYQDAPASLDIAHAEDDQVIPEGQNDVLEKTDPLPAGTETGSRQIEADTTKSGLSNGEEAAPETTESSHEISSKPDAEASAAEGSSRGSSPPFPSIEEIWHTASTSRQTQSPLKASQNSALRQVKIKSDADYEAAMQRLDEGDEGEESDSLPHLKSNSSIRNLFPNATQPSPLGEGIPDSAPKRGRRGPLAPFQVPEGSQVIALSSSNLGSPKSPVFAENDAEDSVDDSNRGADDESSSLPHGSGWVTKSKRAAGKQPKKTRKESVAATTARRGRTPALSASAVSSKRKKNGRKF